MAIVRFRPEFWSALLLTSLKKSHVYAALCNRNYEGEIRAAGDTVRITSISRPTINTYARNTDISYEELTDAQRTLVVDQEKYWAFTLDDVDAAQARADVVPEAMSESAYGLRDVADQFVASLYTGVQAANALGTRIVDAAGEAYDTLVDLGVKLDEANVPAEGRWAVIPPWFHGLMQKDERFTDLSASGDRTLHNGLIGEAAGFRLHKSNNTPNPTADHRVVMAGVPQAITFAEQILKTEALRSEVRFADRVRGLHVYGAKLLRPDALATVVADPST
ncbi:P22 coat protein - protein 5 domain protein [Actinomadura sp. KC06]|uniref:phage major capsid protein n=1 Tax=Actinomadura sp. KC06 TaxID=2530369 RepID=UPI00104A5035|nr:P22 coat protein - protein 5 domain protein [Actinomadura sp. KC06]TDD25048.1 P22 coat protein - protein 5 domain protein [Actinomadura sp. KC06]